MIPIILALVAASIVDSVVSQVVILVIVLIVYRMTMVFPKIVGIMAAVMVAMSMSVPLGETSRSFYGVYTVKRGDDFVVLSHGSTIHGAQFTDAQKRLEPTTYYSRLGPLGDAMSMLHKDGPMQNWALIGVGTGTSLVYAQPEENVTAFEIDPLDIEIASNPKNFTFVDSCRANLTMIVGDGRLRMAEQPDKKFNAIVLDAFSSDSIPTHLLTDEALTVYRSKLADDGLLLLHITNRNINLEPVVKGLASQQNMSALMREDNSAEPTYARTRSTWVAMSTDPATIEPLRKQRNWTNLGGREVTWTDNFSNIATLIRY